MLGGVSFREGTSRDLRATYGLAQRAIHGAAALRGLVSSEPPSEVEIEADWRRERPLVEFLAAQPGGSYWIAELDGAPVGYARVVAFPGVEQISELMVDPDHQGRGIGGELLARSLAHEPSREVGRLVVATGQPNDLGLYMGFGLMPAAGHWQLRCPTSAFVERRSREVNSRETSVVALKPERAVLEWLRLERPAMGYERRALHEFFARERACLATFDERAGVARSLCWVSSEGEIGPGAAESPGILAAVVLAALDRVAATLEPEYLRVFATTGSWRLLRRLRLLGFEIRWPSWIMSSQPLPRLDCYLPVRPPYVL